MFWGTFIISDYDLVGLEISSTYRVVSGVNSSQFLGRESKKAELKLVFITNVLRRIEEIEELADAGNARGLDVNFSNKTLEGLFACAAYSKRLTKNLVGVIVRAEIDLTLVEDRGQI